MAEPELGPDSTTSIYNGGSLQNGGPHIHSLHQLVWEVWDWEEMLALETVGKMVMRESEAEETNCGNSIKH